jgi:hypothetical protein
VLHHAVGPFCKCQTAATHNFIAPNTHILSTTSNALHTCSKIQHTHTRIHKVALSEQMRQLVPSSKTRVALLPAAAAAMPTSSSHLHGLACQNGCKNTQKSSQHARNLIRIQDCSFHLHVVHRRIAVSLSSRRTEMHHIKSKTTPSKHRCAGVHDPEVTALQ